MLKLILSRLALVVPALIVIGTLAFTLIYFVPGSPAVAVLGFSATPEAIARVESQLGFDRPYIERLAVWLSNAAQGDLGRSLRSNAPVSDLLTARLPATLSLVFGGLVVALSFGIGLGLLAGINATKVADRAVTGVVSFFQAVPEFWFGLILLLIFVMQLRLVPVVSYVPITDNVLLWARGLILPSLALGFGTAALVARQTRTGIAAAMSSLYVDALRASGVPRRIIIWRYALKNAMVPVLAAAGLTCGILIGGSLVMERVFAFPGLGGVMLGSVISKDFPIVQGGALLIGTIVILINLLVDIGYGLINPKARPQ